ncbi:MAG: 2-C-methyl-D-erythritol 2,4-cyclodiphosphate synthase [Clostridia bacterium]|nr:2-C-methyl-D-erythritol 2,4-cyclodiphosphate synthase [Clostridia bacterium]
MRIGHGIDFHRLVENRDLYLGGVKIEYEKGLLGHSDADVLLHAICDSLLGAAAKRDIGYHFPDSDEKFKGISSLKLLELTREIILPYKVVNIDATVIAQAPKLMPHIEKMRENVAKALDTDINNINIKATTSEHMGYCGSGEGMEAHAICLVD